MKIDHYKYCLIIPTYNNEKTLKRVIDGVLLHFAGEDIIIINDGATDSTASILKEYKEINKFIFLKTKEKETHFDSVFVKLLMKDTPMPLPSIRMGNTFLKIFRLY